MGNKVLKITKPDKTTHILTLSNKAFWTAYNNRLPEAQKVKIDEVDEDDVKNQPFIDENHVSASEAIVKVDELNMQLSEKDNRIAELEALLAKTGQQKESAADVIAKIGFAETIEAVNEIAAGDDRKTVKDAAERRIAQLSNPQ